MCMFRMYILLSSSVESKFSLFLCFFLVDWIFIFAPFLQMRSCSWTPTPLGLLTSRRISESSLPSLQVIVLRCQLPSVLTCMLLFFLSVTVVSSTYMSSVIICVLTGPIFNLHNSLGLFSPLDGSYLPFKLDFCPFYM